MGTGEIGLPVLDWLIQSPKHEVVGVVTQPDKPVGRKKIITSPQTKLRAQAAGIPVFQPEKIRHAVEELAAFEPDVAVVVAYGQILSRAVLGVPKRGCLNIHASLLPRYRGASPIQAAIREGDAETGVTIMFMDEGLDTGDILLMQSLPILATDTGGVLHDKLAVAAPAALEKALDCLTSSTCPREPQNNAEATHCGKLQREHGQLDWSRSAAELERLIRAYNPWPGTYTLLPEGNVTAQLKIHQARVLDGVEACPAAGTVIEADPKKGWLVACGSGVLALEEVQTEGGKRLPVAEFLRGHPVAAGTVLG